MKKNKLVPRRHQDTKFHKVLISFSSCLRVFVACLCILALTGCGRFFKPTYPQDEIPAAIQKLCKEEYNITEKIDTKIVGRTLGVRIHFDELLDINLKLQEKAVDKLQNLLRIIRRICLSTDAQLDFYVIIGYEKKLGIEAVFYSYVDDLKRAIAGWMSPDDYFQRLIKTMRMDTLRWGNNRIDKFTKDIESGNMVKVIVNNFAAGTKLSDLTPAFLRILTDMSKKTYIRWYLLKTHSIPTKGQERLYYIEAKEYYTPKSEEAENLQYPSGTIHRLYMLIGMEDLNPVIKSIYTPAALPDRYGKLGLPSAWDEEDFFVEDFVFHEFLSTQIVQRIQSELSGDKEEEKEAVPDITLKGDFIITDRLDTQVRLTDPSKNIFKMTIGPKKGNTLLLPQKIKDVILKTIREVCDKYKFYDLGEIQLVDNKGSQLLKIDKFTLFRKDH